MNIQYVALALVTLAAVAAFLVGRHYARATVAPPGVRVNNRPVTDPAEALRVARFLGRAFMIAAPVMWLVATAILLTTDFG